MITWMKNVNNFQIVKVKLQGVAYHLLDFFANFSLGLLTKVLLIKKMCTKNYFMRNVVAVCKYHEG